MRYLTAIAGFCLSALPLAAEPPQVVADIGPVHGLVADVMAGVGTPDLLVPTDASPHAANLRPSQARALQDADALFWIGPNLTPWLEDAVGNLSPQARSIALLSAPETRQLELRETVIFGDEHHEHEHDHDHDHDTHGVDPHAWLDPQNATVWLRHIAETLAEIDPDNAATYRANAAATSEALTEQATRIETQLADLSDFRFVVFHDAYQYFEARFGLRPVGAISLSDATPPGAARLATLRDQIAAEGVTCLLSEPQFDPGLISAVAGESTIRSEVVDPLGSALSTGPGFYAALMTGIAASYTACASGS